MNMQDEILRLWQRSNHIVLMVTHDIDEALHLGTRIIVMAPQRRSRSEENTYGNVSVLLVSGAFAMTPEEELGAWKKEPAYGRIIKAGNNRGLCTGTLDLVGHTIAITTSIGGSITMRFLLATG